jgi:transposase-like protein
MTSRIISYSHHYRGVPRQYFHLYLKEIEVGFNRRDEDLFQILANIVVKAVPNSPNLLYHDK